MVQRSDCNADAIGEVANLCVCGARTPNGRYLLGLRCIINTDYGLRDYGHPDQIGLEATPTEYLATMVEVFRLVRDLLADDGVLWVNIGDSYNAAGRTGHGTRVGFKQGTSRASATGVDRCRPSVDELKPKDLIGIP